MTEFDHVLPDNLGPREFLHEQLPDGWVSSYHDGRGGS